MIHCCVKSSNSDMFGTRSVENNVVCAGGKREKGYQGLQVKSCSN